MLGFRNVTEETVRITGLLFVIQCLLFLVCNSCYCGFHANFSELLTGCDETSLKCQAGNMMLKKGLVITFKLRKNISELNNNFENRTKIDLFLNFVLEGN